MGKTTKKRQFLANMQIISLNMRDTKMSQAEMDSTEKIGLETVEKSLIHIRI